jgi:hypothetical protein
VHRFLRKLAKTQAIDSPVPVRIGAGGEEEVSFIPGDVAVQPYPAWSMSEGALASVGRLIRRFHDASRSIQVDPLGQWPTDLSDPEGGDFLCHNDVCLENVVFRDGDAVGLIDFDLAAPGRPVWDLAMAARYWVPLLDPESASASGRAHLDPGPRLRILVDAYGLPVEDRAMFMSVVQQATEVARAFVADRVDVGDANFIQALDEHGGWRRWDRIQSWLADRSERFTDLLCS